LRLGAAEVTLVYRRTRAEMPASPEELEDALEEGVNIIELVAPLGITELNGAAILECQRMRQGPLDSSGRRRSLPVEGDIFNLEFDSVIGAIGQRLEIGECFGLPLIKQNAIGVEKYSLATPVAGVFAGGDAVRGPSSIIESIADGRQAAKSIDLYLGGDGDISEKLSGPAEDIGVVAEPGEGRSVRTEKLPVNRRLDSFAMVESGYDREQALEEACRCLHCDLEPRE
jgi:NADPH-dependent glutamate synthase beta subunit-like oxidoreductase